MNEQWCIVLMYTQYTTHKDRLKQSKMYIFM